MYTFNIFYIFVIFARISFSDDVFDTQMIDFSIDDFGMSCINDPHYQPFNQQIRGVNIGGWMVLEPWITPSLFYQFLGKDEKNTAMDFYTFCDVLGPIEGNKQLMIHWKDWLTEDYFIKIVNSGINSVRLPVGDWMYLPYGPYIGCTDGSLEMVDWLLDMCEKYDISVLIDLHAVKDSQNGFDNSGQTKNIVWTNKRNDNYIGSSTFEHWTIRNAEWIGQFNSSTSTYDTINQDNIDRILNVIYLIVNKYQHRECILGIEPLNEPWQLTPIDNLKRFYWEGYKIVKKNNFTKNWKYIIHDSFRFDINIWGGFMDGCPDIGIDSHIYQAWNDPSNSGEFYNEACKISSLLIEMERSFGPVIVGEWSLATDNCAMWLNGFNDNLPGYPKITCKYIKCPISYMDKSEKPHFVEYPDPNKPILPPFGTGVSSPSYGMCPTDIDWSNIYLDNFTKINIQNTRTDEDKKCSKKNTNNEVLRKLAHKKLCSFSRSTHGWYFWNFRTELSDRWNYLKAVDNNWIPRDISNFNPKINKACFNEDNGYYKCFCKKNIFDSTVKNGMIWIQTQNKNTNISWIQKLKGKTLLDSADIMFNTYWHQNIQNGISCDFGGAAQLIEIPFNSSINNKTKINHKKSKSKSKYKIYQTILIVLITSVVMLLVWILGNLIKKENKYRKKNTLQIDEKIQLNGQEYPPAYNSVEIIM